MHIFSSNLSLQQASWPKPDSWLELTYNVGRSYKHATRRSLFKICAYKDVHIYLFLYRLISLYNKSHMLTRLIFMRFI